MRGQITFRGWVFAGLAKTGTVWAETYRNQEGWTAREVFRGRDNQRIGLIVFDEAQKPVGVVQAAAQLP